MLTYAETNCDVVRVLTGQRTLTAGSAALQLMQADTDPGATYSDNERSVACLLKLFGQTLLLPGDMEGESAVDLFRRIGPVDALVSPHHGSRKANTPLIGDILKPQYVVVSAKDDDARPHIYSAFADSEQQYFTSTDGATTIILRKDRPLEVDTYVKRQTAETPVK